MYMKHGKVKFGYKDSYDFEILSDIIGDWLTNFREVIVKRNNEGKCVGVPCLVLNEYYGQEFVNQKSMNGGLSNEEIDKAFEFWIGLIDQMIFAFTSEEPSYNGGWIEDDNHGVLTEDGNTAWSMRPNPEKWQEHQRECAAWKHKVDCGRMLFAKYSSHLWW